VKQTRKISKRLAFLPVSKAPTNKLYIKHKKPKPGFKHPEHGVMIG
jgi:hypothetical protein